MENTPSSADGPPARGSAPVAGLDPYLAALARAAEAGKECPFVRLSLQSGDLVIGQPTKSREFIDATYTALQQEAVRALNARTSKQRSRDPGDADGLAAERVAPINIQVADLDRPAALTLGHVQVFWGGRADGVKVRALRVHLSAIALWWVTGEQQVKAPSGGIGVGVGALFPIDT